MRILILYLVLFFSLTACKKEKSTNKDRSGPINARTYKPLIDSVIMRHTEFYNEVMSDPYLADSMLIGTKIEDRRLFKNKYGGIAGIYSLIGRNKLLGEYKVLINEDSSHNLEFYLLKQKGEVQIDSGSKKEKTYSVVDRKGRDLSDFRFSDLFNTKNHSGAKSHTHSKEKLGEWKSELTMMYYLQPSGWEFVFCGLCGYLLQPDSYGYYWDCECPNCGISLLYPLGISNTCPNFGQEVSPVGGGGSGGGGGGTGGGGNGTDLPGVVQLEGYFPMKAEWKNFLNNYANLEILNDLLRAIDLNEVNNASIQATKATLDALVTNKLNGPYDLNHTNMWVPHLEALQGVSPSFIHPQLMAYFSAQCAMIRFEHPNWSNARVYWEAVKELVHTGLDVIGLVPVVGELADLANGIIYTIEGDGVNATLSYAATIPFAGWAATATKYARKTIIAIDGSKRTLNWIKLSTGVIEFGDRGLLRKVLGLGKFDPRAAHHIIPWEHGTSDLVQKAAVGNTTSFHMNEALNGIALTSIQHSGSHNLYNQRVLDKLADLWQTNGGASMTPATARALIDDLITDIRTAIINNPNTPINNIIF